MGVLKRTTDLSYGPETRWWGEYLAQYKQASRLARGARVLDIGCGQGFGSLFLFDHGALSVTGVDVESANILKAQQGHGRDGVGFTIADVSNLPFAPKTFDVVTCFQVIERLGLVDQALHQIHRILTDDGTAIFSTVNRKRFSELTEAPADQSHLQEYDFEEFKKILSRNFSICDIQGLFCTRLMGPELLTGHNKTLEFLRLQLENHISWKLRNKWAKRIFGVSYYPDETEYVLRSIGVEEAPLFFAVCKK